MKIKLDENLPVQLAPVLINLGHDTHTMREEGLAGCSDREVWEAVQKETRFLITQDLDFSDGRQFTPRHIVDTHAITQAKGFNTANRTIIPE